MTESDHKREAGTDNPLPKHAEKQPGVAFSFEVPLDCQTGECVHSKEIKRTRQNLI